MADSVAASSYVGRFISDRYRIDRLLASGGMGDVYLATDLHLDKRVALKLLKGTLIGTVTFLERFRQEVRVCTHLESPHIVQVNDYGITAEGKPFYVMEYLQGETLGHCLTREGRLPPDQVVSIMTQICAGVEVAHAGVEVAPMSSLEKRKIIHRDLKPDNIFLIPLAAGVLVKILDFGIAKVCYEELAEQSRHLTGSQVFLGTPRYASPEQISRKTTLDERADIYSLGMMLYEMLSGGDPFGFKQQRQRPTWISWAMAHTTTAILPLRSQPGCEGLPVAIEQIVSRCLEKGPSDRFASVTELRQALMKALQEASLKGTPRTQIMPQVPPTPATMPPLPAAPLSLTPTIPDRHPLGEAMTDLPVPPSSLEADGAAQPAVAQEPVTDPEIAAHSEMNSVTAIAASPKPDSHPGINSHSQPSLTPSGQVQALLEKLLLQAIGPIAPLVLQQTLEQTQDMDTVTETLVSQLPISQQRHFRQQLQQILAQVHSQATPTPSGMSPKTAPPAPLETGLDPAFIQRCQQELTHCIGPLASFLIQELLDVDPPLQPLEFIQALANRIPNPQQAEIFRQRCLSG